MAYRNIFLIAFGWICVGLGIVGAVLPVMPSTVFLLIAAWAFAKGSPRLHGWLLDHPRLGSYIRDWELYGAIPLRGKITALVMISLSASWMVFFSALPAIAIGGTLSVLACVLIFIFTRPSAAPEGEI